MNPTRFFSALLLCCALTAPSVAQIISISGSVLNENQKPVEDAIVQLLSAKDSALVKTEITSETGTFVFEGIMPGNFLIQITAVNYQKYLSAPFKADNELRLPASILKASAVDLKEVSVTARKPYIEKEKGKIILNVENSINAQGSSVFEVIE